MTGVLGAMFTNVQPVISISNLTVSGLLGDNTDYELQTDGDISVTDDGGTTVTGTWINDVSLKHLFEVRLTVSSGTSPNTGSSDSINAWLDFSTNRNWGLTGTGLTGNWLVEIRYKSGLVADSATITHET